jgi:hypothetical protein
VKVRIVAQFARAPERRTLVLDRPAEDVILSEAIMAYLDDPDCAWVRVERLIGGAFVPDIGGGDVGGPASTVSWSPVDEQLLVGATA